MFHLDITTDPTHLSIFDLNTTVCTTVLSQSNLSFQLNAKVLELLEVFTSTASAKPY